MGRIKRETKETRIDLSIRSGAGEAEVETGEPFLTHMLETFARYGGLELKVSATGGTTWLRMWASQWGSRSERRCPKRPPGTGGP